MSLHVLPPALGIGIVIGTVFTLIMAITVIVLVMIVLKCRRHSKLQVNIYIIIIINAPHNDNKCTILYTQTYLMSPPPGPTWPMSCTNQQRKSFQILYMKNVFLLMKHMCMRLSTRLGNTYILNPYFIVFLLVIILTLYHRVGI